MNENIIVSFTGIAKCRSNISVAQEKNDSNKTQCTLRTKRIKEQLYTYKTRVESANFFFNANKK